MHTFESSDPTTAPSGHLVLSGKVRDQIRERLLALLDLEMRRVAHRDDPTDDDPQHRPVDLMNNTVEIRAALARLDSDAYGVCEVCSGAIPIERLDALPTARTCVSCQVSAGKWFR